MSQAWFEMKDIRRRSLNAAVWIPLRAAIQDTVGEFGFAGHQSEFFGAGSVAVPIENRESADSQLGWGNIGVSQHHQPSCWKGTYLPSDLHDFGEGMPGVYLVLNEHTNNAESEEWHLHQDFVLALCLKREGDSWVSPKEGYIEVARLRRDSNGSPSLLEVRAEHLRDYLCARGMALYVATYRERRQVVEDAAHIDWPEGQQEEKRVEERWERRKYAIHEGGQPFGCKTAVLHISRTDVDPELDVPTIGLSGAEGNVEAKSWTVQHEGKKLFVLSGALWRSEWVEPSDLSPRIRGDNAPPTVFFVTDAKGTRESRATLIDSGKWLWFRPEVMTALLQYRGGRLVWNTQETGAVRCSPDDPVHFGVNRLGLINVFAKDIAGLPDWQQQIWAGHNVGPEGGVSEELLAAQAKAQPASTQAPEGYLARGLRRLATLSNEKLGFPLIREHPQRTDILSRCHRFRAIDRPGFLALAKDLARLTADSIDANAVHRYLGLPKGKAPGSLKSLEQLLATRMEPGAAREMMGPLFAVYELRTADAHLPSGQVDQSLLLAGVDKDSPPVHQGLQLLHACVSSIYSVAEVVEEWPVAAESDAD